MNRREREINEILGSSHFARNKFMMSFWGIWPYQSFYDKIWRQIIFVVVVTLSVAPHIWGVRLLCGRDIPGCASNIGAICFGTGVFIKFLVPLIYISKFKKVLEVITEIWSTTADLKVFEEYGNLNNIKSAGYIVYCSIGGFAFSHFYLLPVIMDYFIPMNETRNKLLVLSGTEYPFNPFDYYFEYYMGYIVITFTLVSMILTSDNFYSAIVHQCIATFAVTEARLKKICAQKNEKSTCDSIISTVKLHKHALQFKEYIASIYYIPFIIYIGGSVLLITVGSLCVVFLYASNRIEQIRMFLFAFGSIIHLFFVIWPGQLLITHSENLLLSIYSSRWYELSDQATTMLKIIMQRCQRPCFLTVAGVYVLNFENFGSILRTIVSCITVALSLQK